MRAFGAFVLLVAAMALGTWVGWWMVPLVAALWGWLRPAVPRRILSAAAAAALAWALWLAADVVRGHDPLGVLAEELAAILRVPHAALVLVTLLFPALLGWSAAGFGSAAAGQFDSRSGDTP
jgi:hypothetical protein